MNKWVRLLAKFYPASWRQRYGAEFDALLDDTRAGWRDVCGAMMMQMSMNYRNMTMVCGLAGLILATGLAFWIPNIYVSHAVVHMNWGVISENSSETPLYGGDAWNEKITQITAKAFSRASLASIIQRPDLDLYKNDRTRKPLEDVIEEMKQKDIKIHVLNTNSSAMNFMVAFKYPDPVIAQKALQALISKLADTINPWPNTLSTGKRSQALTFSILLEPSEEAFSPESLANRVDRTRHRLARRHSGRDVSKQVHGLAKPSLERLLGQGLRIGIPLNDIQDRLLARFT